MSPISASDGPREGDYPISVKVDAYVWRTVRHEAYLRAVTRSELVTAVLEAWLDGFALMVSRLLVRSRD